MITTVCYIFELDPDYYASFFVISFVIDVGKRDI
jgi:hypothetical protein